MEYANDYTIPGTNLIKLPQQLFPIEVLSIDHGAQLITEDLPMAAFQVIWAFPAEDDPVPVYDTETMLPISVASDDPFPFRNERLELPPMEKKLKRITVDYVVLDETDNTWLNGTELFAKYTTPLSGPSNIAEAKWVLISYETE